MTLFDRIKETAKKRGYSIAEVERKAGVSTNYMYQWKTRKPNPETLNSVAKVLGVSVDYLLGDDKPESEKVDDNSATGVIAAHIDDDTPEEERQQIINFIENLKKARGQK